MNDFIENNLIKTFQTIGKEFYKEFLDVDLSDVYNLIVSSLDSNESTQINEQKTIDEEKENIIEKVMMISINYDKERNFGVETKNTSKFRTKTSYIRGLFGKINKILF